MKVKKRTTMTWEEAPDTIGPDELAKILGIGEPNARAKFDEKGFPRIPGLGNLRKADKQVARLYLQGINIKTNQKEAITELLLFELKQLNTNLQKVRMEGFSEGNLQMLVKKV